MWQNIEVTEGYPTGRRRRGVVVSLFVAVAGLGPAACELTSLGGLTGGSGADGGEHGDGATADVGPGDAGPRDTGVGSDSSVGTDGGMVDAPTKDGPVLPPDGGSGSDASTTYAQEVLDDHPLAYYRLDDTALPVAKDSSGNGNNGAYVGGVVLTIPGALQGDPDTAVELNGTNAYVDVASKFDFTGSAPFSLEVWILATLIDDEFRGILTNQSGYDGGRDGYLMYLQAEAGTGLERWDNNMSNPLGAPPGILGVGKWAHMVGTFDGTSLNLYVDGALVAGPFASPLVIPPHGCAFVVGALFCGTAGYFAGGVDEVAVYDHALPAARIKVHYRVGTGLLP